MNPPGIVYRVFNAAGVLLYIGSTRRIALRLREHRASKPWWSEVARIDLAIYDDEAEARREERRAILAECPRYNIERHPVVVPPGYHLPAWNPLPSDLKARLAKAGRKRARTPAQTPGRDDELAACLYEALSLGCQPSPVARAAGVDAEIARRVVKRHLLEHPELPPIPVRQSLAARAA